MFAYSFKKLEVWLESKKPTKDLYAITKNFPTEEKLGLTSQNRRASISVCSNIAEGSSRKTNKDKAHFTITAFSSAVDILNQIIITHELDKDLREQIESITNKLNVLKNYQIN